MLLMLIMIWKWGGWWKLLSTNSSICFKVVLASDKILTLIIFVKCCFFVCRHYGVVQIPPYSNKIGEFTTVASLSRVSSYYTPHSVALLRRNVVELIILLYSNLSWLFRNIVTWVSQWLGSNRSRGNTRVKF